MTATTTTPFAQSTDAEFRLWAQWIHDKLDAAGWVNTSDTGQINLTTVAKPAAANTSQGYEIWRMADALQATNPVFMKIEYGSGGAATVPAVWVTIGTASNGSGTLTGNVSTRTQTTAAAGDSTARNSYFSGNTDRFVFAIMADSTVTQSSGIIFGVERTKDSTGANSTEGAHFFCIGPSTTITSSQMMTFSGSMPPADALFLSGLQAGTTGVFGSDAYTFPIYPNGFYPRNPIMNAVGYFAADLTREVSITLDIYGANHTYLPVGNPTAAGQRYTALDRINSTALTRLAIRYE